MVVRAGSLKSPMFEVTTGRPDGSVPAAISRSNVPIEIAANPATEARLPKQIHLSAADIDLKILECVSISPPMLN